MRVTLAGATQDLRFWKDDPAATPETIAAASARLSHSPSTMAELRNAAASEVEKARRSNEMIVYRMGHSSIAEHAVFNMDVEDCSRLLVEFLERHRLASYTERSQRYVFFGGKTFQIPSELSGTGLEARAEKLEEDKFDLYREASEDGELKDRYGDKLLEQTRYVLGLTCPTDVAMTVNARELEHIISEGLCHGLMEIRELSRQLLGEAGKLAPSLIKHTDGGAYRNRAAGSVKEMAGRMECPHSGGEGGISTDPCERRVRILGDPVGDDPEAVVVASILLESTRTDMNSCIALARGMSCMERADLLDPYFRNYPPHASMPRPFEMLDVAFELDISASGFAQLKRHRMSTILVQDYLPDRWVKPPVYRENPGYGERFDALMERSRLLYREIEEAHGAMVARYVLTNAHVRRAVVKMNVRELYHFARLRSDEHAQDEIRAVSDRMVELARERYPLTTAMLCGKDAFDESLDRFCK